MAVAGPAAPDGEIDTHDDRASRGRLCPQPGGYRAFMPAPLPPKPPVRLDGLLQARLSAAAGALGRLNGAVGTLSDADLLILMCARKEAVLSSRVEGAQSMPRDLLAAEAGRFAPGRADDTKDVANYVTAMNYGLERLLSLLLSARPIRDIHGRLMRGMRDDTKSRTTSSSPRR